MTSGSKPELLPPSAPTPTVTADDVAALSERFYDFFSDVPPRGARDLEYFRGLLLDFSASVDIADELKRFQAWSLDKGIHCIRSCGDCFLPRIG